MNSITVKDHSVTGESFSLDFDTTLELLRTTPQPSLSEIGRYYESPDYISHTDSARGWFEKIYQAVKKRALKNKISILANYQKCPGMLLDFGCGTGDFLVEAKHSGWTCTGFEPNENARQRALSKGIQLTEGVENLQPASFDAITLWHVLEHVHDVNHHLEVFSKLLKPNGILVIAVPNFRSFDAVHYHNYWAAYDVPRHIWHFSRTAIAKLAANAGMHVVREHPMWFDAFYVSLLSERYKTGRMNPLKAFWVGFRSNLKAIRSGEFSSVIYILKNNHSS